MGVFLMVHIDGFTNQTTVKCHKCAVVSQKQKRTLKPNNGTLPTSNASFTRNGGFRGSDGTTFVGR